MSEQIKLLKQLLEHLESYQDKVGNADIKEFSIYLKDKVVSGLPANEERHFDKNNYFMYQSYPEVEFSSLLNRLYRFAKHYTKKVFSSTDIKTIDEFGFLETLLNKKSLLKNELIHLHLLETSSGSEVLKRLVKNGLVQEFPDEKDKRAKRVSLTPKGDMEILNALDDMHLASEIIIGNLTKEEIVQGLAIFNKLSYFHHHIYEKDKNSTIPELHKKYIPKKSEEENSDHQWSWSAGANNDGFID